MFLLIKWGGYPFITTKATLDLEALFSGAVSVNWMRFSFISLLSLCYTLRCMPQIFFGSLLILIKNLCNNLGVAYILVGHTKYPILQSQVVVEVFRRLVEVGPD